MFRGFSHSSGQIAYSSSYLIWTLDDVCTPLCYHWYFVVFLSASFPRYLRYIYLNFKLMLCWFLFIIHIDTVEIGGSGNVRLGRNDYVYVKAASKPSGMALRLADKLFPKTTLMRSTVQGTKDFAPLDPTIISAIKGQWSILIHMHITCVILYFLVCFLVIHLFIFLCHFTCCKIKCPTTTSVFFSKTMSCIEFIIIWYHLLSHVLLYAKKYLQGKRFWLTWSRSLIPDLAPHSNAKQITLNM